ncbi:unnamed protein product [Rotaria sp. Silwood2]|nr:unnamed protein product [Rotaria sp. Silwood2]CAF3029738.1 unnamed protein product [Rotaria sp. Silwood2]CAF4215046.1 unnamed protein product [Rotaria sp. Silwood2]CAF4295957.1 unnamed protein product [Rotaria sp. Silwood2]CAF4313879.1 unnamed protein product [Rotaria sp. Silwood2]
MILFSSSDGIKHFGEFYLAKTIVISEMNTVASNNFDQKYFGEKEDKQRSDLNISKRKQNDNHSWIDQAFSPYDLIEQNSREDLSNKILHTVLYGQVHKLKRLRNTNKERTINIHHLNDRNHLKAEQITAKDDQTDRPFFFFDFLLDAGGECEEAAVKKRCLGIAKLISNLIEKKMKNIVMMNVIDGNIPRPLRSWDEAEL